MNYRVQVDNYIEYGVELTEEEVGKYDNRSGSYEVFATFTQAKNNYLKQLRKQRDNWNDCIRHASKLNKNDIQ